MKKNKGKSNFIINSKMQTVYYCYMWTNLQTCQKLKLTWGIPLMQTGHFFSHSTTLFYRKLEKCLATYVLIPWQEGLWLFVVQSHHQELNISQGCLVMGIQLEKDANKKIIIKTLCQRSSPMLSSCSNQW